MGPLDRSRRSFLQGSGAVAGALVLGLVLPLRSRAAAGATVPADAAVNAYIRIASNGQVTLIVPKSEMGQGVYTGFAQILAEELDVPLTAVSIEAAPVAAVYNVPFAPMQYTGGSSSISSSFMLLRKAGAAARAMLISAAATELGVPAASLVAADGQVTHAASGRRVPYGALAREGVL